MEPTRLSFIQKTVYVLLIITLFFGLISTAKSILIPIYTSAILSFAMYPMVARLRRLGLPEVPAILITMLIIVALLMLLLLWVGAQITGFMQDMPDLTYRFNDLVNFIQTLLEEKFNIKYENQINLLSEYASRLFTASTSILTSTISTTSNVLFILGILPVYIFFMIYYRRTYQQFVLDFVPPENKAHATHVMNEISHVMQQYVGGLGTVILIVAFLNSIGFFILGINYAIFFGLLISLLAIIPYFGLLIGSSIAALYTLLTTGSLLLALGVVGVTAVVQFLEGNLITPYIMGNRVQLNPLSVLFFLLLGGSVWGAMGMILAVPSIAILKMVCDNVAPLKPFGRVLGVESEVAENPVVEAEVNNLPAKGEDTSISTHEDDAK